jgi:hypothetical protein
MANLILRKNPEARGTALLITITVLIIIPKPRLPIRKSNYIYIKHYLLTILNKVYITYWSLINHKNFSVAPSHHPLLEVLSFVGNPQNSFIAEAIFFRWPAEQLQEICICQRRRVNHKSPAGIIVHTNRYRDIPSRGRGRALNSSSSSTSNQFAQLTAPHSHY